MASDSDSPPAAATDAAPRKGLKRYAPELEADAFAFQAVAYPERDPALIPARWRWMFVDSAARHGSEPRIWLYYRKGELVAHQGAITVSCKIGQDELPTGWFVETMVLEKVRGGPVGAALVAQALEDMPFNLSLGQSPVMRELQYRLGWEKVGALDTWVLPLAVGPLLGERPLAARLLLSAPLAAWMTLARWRRGRAGRGLTTAVIARFDQRHRRLWERVAVHYACAVRRDDVFLNWKFVDQPGQSFTALEVREGDEARGVVVLAERAPRGPYRYARLEICEIVVAPDDRQALFALLTAAVELARQRGIAAIYLHIREARLERLLRHFGFVQRTSTRWLLLAMKTLAPAQRQLAAAIDNWLLTGSDSDIDRPQGKDDDES
ncbi:MAG: GNAT family N-acetyltransferase [Gammaproteobacteria bacterium]